MLIHNDLKNIIKKNCFCIKPIIAWFAWFNFATAIPPAGGLPWKMDEKNDKKAKFAHSANTHGPVIGRGGVKNTLWKAHRWQLGVADMNPPKLLLVVFMFFFIVFVMHACRNTDSPMTILSWHLYFPFLVSLFLSLEVNSHIQVFR